MSQVPETIWAVDIEWDPVTLGVKLNEAGDDFEYVYNENAVAQVIKLAIRDSDFAQQMINSHSSQLPLLLNKLKDELEDKEWGVALGSISLDINLKTSQLIFNGLTTHLPPKPIRVALDLTKDRLIN